MRKKNGVQNTKGTKATGRDLDLSRKLKEVNPIISSVLPLSICQILNWKGWGSEQTWKETKQKPVTP